MTNKVKSYLYMLEKNAIRGVFALVLLGFAVPSIAASRAIVDKVREANDAYIAGRYEDAIKAYELVEVDNPSMPELSYNMGLSYYRMRDFEKARELFNESLSTRDLDLEARAKFNLGNVAYSQALEKLSAIPEAIEKAKQAISHYRDVLEIHPEDIDARANIETAQLLVKDLLDKRKKELEKQKQEQDKQEQKEQEKQDQQCDNPQQQDNKEQEGEKKDQDKKENEGDKQEQQQQQNEQQEQSQQQADEQQQEAQAQPAEVKEEMTQEQAERMLQAVRDREAKRREEQARKLRAKRVPVSRDW